MSSSDNNNTENSARLQQQEIPEGAEVFEIHEVDWDALRLGGWSENAIKKAVSCGCIDEGTCEKWLYMHVDHPDLNKPLEGNVYVKIKEKFKLTPEQRAAKVEELKARIKAKREAEAQSKLHSEKDRIEDGKKALASAEARKQYKREQEERERKREKEADRIAKEKVLFELEVDRLKRTGLNEEEARKKAHEEQEEKKVRAKKAHEEYAAQLRQQQEEEERRAKENGESTAGGKKPWNLGAILPHVASDPVPSSSQNNNSINNNNNNGNNNNNAAAAVMNMFASTANFYPKEMEDYTPFPEFVPSKKFLKNPSASGISTSTDEDPTNQTFVVDFSDASPKDVLKTLLVMVKEQVEGAQQDPKAVFSTLRRILSAVRDNLAEPKIRSLKPTGGLFRSHLSAYPNTLLFLRAVGFQKHTPPAPPKDPNTNNQQMNNNDDSNNSNQPPAPAFELKYCDVALLFAALAALDEVEAGNV